MRHIGRILLPAVIAAIVAAALALFVASRLPRRAQEPAPVQPLLPEIAEGDAELADASDADDLNAMVYYNANGLCYHALPDCSGMQNAFAYPVRAALAAGKRYCPVCQPMSPTYADWFADTFGQDFRALYPGYNYRCAAKNAAGFDTWLIENGGDDTPVCVVESEELGFSPAPMNWKRGDVRLNFVINETADAAGFLSKAPEPLKSMLAVDLASLNDDTARAVSGMLGKASPAKRMNRMQVTYNRDGRLTEFCMQLPGGQGIYYLTWTLEADGYKLYLAVQTNDYFMRAPEPVASVAA